MYFKLIFIYLTFQIYFKWGYGQKLIILNGYSSENKVELFDFDSLHSSTLLADTPGDEHGKGQAWLTNEESSLLICGGEYTKHNSHNCRNPKCYSYSILDNSWSELKNQPEKNVESGIYETVPNVGPIVLGGYKDGKYVAFLGCLGEPIQNSRILTKENKWIAGPETPKLFFRGCSARIDAETSYVAVQDKAYIFNLNTNEFTPVTSMKEASGLNNREYMACTFDPSSGKVIIAGGLLYDSSSVLGTPTNSVKLYDPLTDTYEDGPDLPYAVEGAALSLIGKEIVLSGGSFGENTKPSSDLLKYSKEGWTKLPLSLRYARSHHNTIVLP